MFWEVFKTVLESNIVYWMYIVIGALLIVLGILMFFGIQKKGKVLLISRLLKNKHYDNETLLSRYKIQAIYTTALGVMFLLLILFHLIAMVNVFFVGIVVSICDGLYDYFAIKTAIKNQKESTLEKENSICTENQLL